MKASSHLDGVACSAESGHDVVRSDEGPAASHDDGHPYCRHCGTCDFGLTDADVTNAQQAAR